MDSLQRVLIEPTDLARSTSDLPPVEGGLLSASLAFSDKRFGKTTEPAANAVVREWIHRTQNQPWRWVVEIAVQQAASWVSTSLWSTTEVASKRCLAAVRSPCTQSHILRRVKTRLSRASRGGRNLASTSPSCSNA